MYVGNKNKRGDFMQYTDKDNIGMNVHLYGGLDGSDIYIKVKDDYLQKHCEYVLKTKDEIVRQNLRKLGWVSPEDFLLHQKAVDLQIRKLEQDNEKLKGCITKILDSIQEIC